METYVEENRAEPESDAAPMPHIDEPAEAEAPEPEALTIPGEAQPEPKPEPQPEAQPERQPEPQPEPAREQAAEAPAKPRRRGWWSFGS